MTALEAWYVVGTMVNWETVTGHWSPVKLYGWILPLVCASPHQLVFLAQQHIKYGDCFHVSELL